MAFKRDLALSSIYNEIEFLMHTAMNCFDQT